MYLFDQNFQKYYCRCFELPPLPLPLTFPSSSVLVMLGTLFDTAKLPVFVDVAMGVAALVGAV